MGGGKWERWKKKEEVKERREKGKEEVSEGRRMTNGIWDR